MSVIVQARPFIKVQLAPFNWMNFQEDLPDLSLTGKDLAGAINNGGGYAAGTTSALTVDAFTTTVAAGSIVKIGSTNDWAYKVQSSSGSPATGITLARGQGLKYAVSDNDIVYVLPYFDITQYVMNISDISESIEPNQNQLILDEQLTIKLANFTSSLYSRTVYSALYSLGNPYFNTNNLQNITDNQYIKISKKINGTWYGIYCGKIRSDRMTFTEPDKEISMMVESTIYSTNDSYFLQAQDMHSCHKYTSSTLNTRTVSGRAKEVIAKIGGALGIDSNAYNIDGANSSVSGQTATIQTTAANGLAVGHVVSFKNSTTTAYSIATVASIISSVKFTCVFPEVNQSIAFSAGTITNGLIVYNCIMDADSNYFSETHRGWSYDFSDAWWINELWHEQDNAQATLKSILDNSLGRAFLAFSYIKYISNVPTFVFRSKKNTQTSQTTFTQNSFVNKAQIEANWRYYSKYGVAADAQSKYFDGKSLSYENHYSYYGTEDKIKGISGGAAIGATTFTVSSELNSIIVPGCVIRFASHSTKYIVKSFNTGTEIVTLYNRLTQSLKSGEYFTIFTPTNLSIENISCLNLKLKYPELFIATKQAGVYRMYNQKSAGDPTDYTASIIVSGAGADMSSGISAVNLIPGMGGHIIPNGRKILHVDNTNLKIYETEELDVQNGTPTGITAEAYQMTGLSSGYVMSRITGQTDKTVLLVCFWTYDFPRTTTNLIVWNFEINDAGNGSNGASFGLYNFTASNRTDMGAETAPVSLAVFFNSDVLNPNSGENIYFDHNSKDLYVTAAYGAGTHSAFMAGTPVAGNIISAFHMAMAESAANEQYIWWADNAHFKIYSTYGATWANAAVEAGGGGTTIALGGNCAATSLSMASATGVWKNYDNTVVFTDVTNQKIYFLNRYTSTVYCISTSAVIASPRQICARDFQGFWIQEDGLYVDFAYNASKLNWAYYGAPRRIIKGDVLGNTLGTGLLKLGDRVTLDSTVVGSSGSGITAWVSKINYNLEDDVYSFEFLEDAAA